MKHLRLFEGFGDDYYVKISLDDVEIYEEEKVFELLTEREKLWIEKNLLVKYWYYRDNCGLAFLRPMSNIYLEDGTAVRDIAIGVDGAQPNGVFEFMYKIEDDYFLCCLNEKGITYYRCDQWEGFIKLLTDKNVI
jgi:hypothetical protein